MANTWSSFGNLNSARDGNGCFGNNQAAVSAGGQSPHGTNVITVEENNGTTWADGTYMTARSVFACFGTLLAGLIAGGIPTTNIAYKYDGTTWAETGSMNSNRDYFMGFGVQGAGYVAGNGGAGQTTESFNGTTWSTSTSLPSPRKYGAASFGTQTAGAVGGGLNSSLEAATFLWNGTSWSTSGNQTYPGFYRFTGGGGSQTNGISLGASPINETTAYVYTEEFNGTTWSAGGDMATGRKFVGYSSAGGSGSFVAGGVTANSGYGTSTNLAEKYSDGVPAYLISKFSDVPILNIAKIFDISLANVKKVGDVSVL